MEIIFDARTIMTQCPMCRKFHEVRVSARDYIRWRNGAHTQEAFPYLSNAQRELLISGVDEECWNKIFDVDDEEED